MTYVYAIKEIFQYYDEDATPEIEVIAIYANEIDAISAAENEVRRQVGEDGTYTYYDGDDCDCGFEADLETGRLNVEVDPYPLRGEPMGRL